MAVAQVNEQNFDQEVLQSQQPVLVDFSAAWCPPCRKMMPVVDALSQELAGEAKVVKVDIDESPSVAQRYGVSSIPHFTVFQNGQAVWNHTGMVAKQALAEATRGV